MKQITICVSPLVKRIFESRYGSISPIKIHRSDVVYHLLQGDPVRVNPNKNKLLKTTLTEKITLEVSYAIHYRLKHKRRQIYIGLFLHKVYQNEILSFMEAQHLAGVPAQKALKTYLQRNNITEDDYALETAYAAWKRKKTFLAQYHCDNNRRFEPTSPPSSVIPKIPHDPRVIIAHTIEYCNKSIEEMTVPERKILSYLLHTECDMIAADIAKHIPVSIRSIQGYIADIKFQYGKYSDVTGPIDSIMAAIRTISTVV